MTISYNWLQDYLPVSIPVNELTAILTSIGLEVEGIERHEAVKGGLEGLIIGKVVECAPHPGADRLRLTKVALGAGDLVQIVCGAPNVAAGQTVVVAPVGTTVHPLKREPFLIKKAKIRGEVSEGMICAEDEIGLGESHDGIIVLPDGVVPGTQAASYYNLPSADIAIHIGLTPNRSDAASHIGVARDVCAWLSHHRGGSFAVRLPASPVPSITETAASAVRVSIREPLAAPRYAGLTLTDITVGPSPEWLQQRLATIGVRAINNVVDITNYVLHEWGQPLHAFDADKLCDNSIVVRFEAEGTAFVTLDDKERKLRGADLMICDSEKGLCIAGVFGGKGSGVSEATNRVFIESAVFDPVHIRRTSLHHGLRTDAATHFEKGVDFEAVIPALNRAAALLVEHCGATVASQLIDIAVPAAPPDVIGISYAYINRLAGKAYAPDAVLTILNALGFTTLRNDVDGLELVPPSGKNDIRVPADIVEEILRIDGLDAIVIPNQLSYSLQAARPSDRAQRRKAADLLAGAGFSEIVTNSITDSKYYGGDEPVVKMLNSLSVGLDAMRLSMLQSGLEVMAYNLARKQGDLRLFETGKVYRNTNRGRDEETQLCLYASGAVPQGKIGNAPVAADSFYLKSVVGLLLQRFGMGAPVEISQEGKTTWQSNGKDIAVVEDVDEKTRLSFGIKVPVSWATIRWKPFLKAASASEIVYAGVPRHPAVQRDLAFVVDDGLAFDKIKASTREAGVDILHDFGLFDIFSNEKLGVGKKSLAMRFTFQAPDRTLTDAEIDAAMATLRKRYEGSLGATVRE